MEIINEEHSGIMKKYIKIEFSFKERIYAFLGFIPLKYFNNSLITEVKQESVYSNEQKSFPIKEEEIIDEDKDFINKIPFFDLYGEDKGIKTNL